MLNKIKKLHTLSFDLFTPEALSITMIILACIGVLDTAYLVWHFFAGTIVPCSIVNGCDTVLKSSYASVRNIPLALFGLAYYVTLSVCAIGFYLTERSRFFLALLGFSLVGFLISCFLVYLQLFVIQAICLYCMGSALISTALFVSALHVLIRTVRNS